MESINKRVQRKVREGRGEMFIPPAENCSLVEFVTVLGENDYELVNAFRQTRFDPKHTVGGRRYSMVRFVFAHHKEAKNEAMHTAKAGLVQMCEQAMWRVRGFINPFFTEGGELAGHSTVSINLEGRTPLFRPDGQPMTVWQKDEEGNRVGDAPLPLKPNFYLRVEEGDIKLVEIGRLARGIR